LKLNNTIGYLETNPWNQFWVVMVEVLTYIGSKILEVEFVGYSSWVYAGYMAFLEHELCSVTEIRNTANLYSTNNNDLFKFQKIRGTMCVRDSNGVDSVSFNFIIILFCHVRLFFHHDTCQTRVYDHFPYTFICFIFFGHFIINIFHVIEIVFVSNKYKHACYNLGKWQYLLPTCVRSAVVRCHVRLFFHHDTCHVW
jgi:hypothetical protein